MSIKNNTTSLQNLLNAVNALPEASGGELPKLTNPGTAETLLLNKQLIDGEGKVITGTFTIDEELNTQDNLIAQITTALEGKAGNETAADDVLKAIIEGTITEIKDSNLQYLRPYAFYGETTLTKVVLPNCAAMISYNYTHPANNMNTVITGSCFMGCVKLSTIILPKCSNIAVYAFNLCSHLTSVNIPAATSIGHDAFAYCKNLTSVDFPAVSYIGENAFYRCSNLTSVNFPVASYIGHDAFDYCSNLTSVDFPAVSYIGDNAFYRCSNLTSVNFPVASYIGDYAFSYCHNLSSLRLGASSICMLSRSNAFTSTPFAGYSAYFSGTPHIYVPASLITAYQSATNWTYFSSYFSSIESLGNNLITFTIDGSEYQAIEGMTWGEWIDSEYNTDDYYYTGSWFVSKEGPLWGSIYLPGDENFLTQSSVIVPNGQYELTT